VTRLFYWIHHTGTYDGNSGVQRVARALAAALAQGGHEILPVRWCAEREAIVHAEARWAEGLARYGGPRLPPGPAAGEALHMAPGAAASLPGAWLVVPEVPHVAGPGAPSLAVALDYARFHGLRSAAVFYDLIPLRFPGYEAMAADHARYARALAGADLVLGISRDCTEDLRRWWDEEGRDPTRLPRLRPLPLPEEMPNTPRATDAGEPPAPPVRFLSFGTLEPRKNQVEAMRAFARLRARRPDLDARFELVGNVHGAVAAEVEEIAAREPRIRLHRYLPDEELRALVQRSHATVFVSRAEGYGLPVAESLWLGRPCLCSDHGSVAEIAEGGGCLVVPASDPAAIEAGLERLAGDPALRGRLAAEARSRPLRRWRDYADALLAALAGTPVLPRALLIEGSAAAADPAPLEGAGVAARRLHWRPASRALLPGAAASPEQPAPGDGRLGGLWAVLPAATCAGPGEAAEIVGAAQGLGLRVALEAPPGPGGDWLPALAAADLALFADAAGRDAALAAALRDLPRTATLRGRFRAGTGAEAPAAIAPDLPRTAAAGAPEPVRRVFYWVGLTVTQPFNTGVQRVTRRLAAALERRGVEVVPVKWDAAAGRIAPLSDADAEALARFDGPPARPRPPLPERLAGEWLLLPEIALGGTAPEGGPLGFARRLGMRTAAVFYDLIPEKMPENYPAVALEALRAYWSDFASADLALPISWSVSADLARWLSARSLHLPAILPCPLAGDVGGPRATEPPAAPAGDEALRLFAVGTWEPRKNYPRLLRALLAAQRRSPRRIELVVVGRRAGFTELDAEIERLAAETGAELLDHAEEAELHRRQRHAHATVFASWEEGFGLPVLESLWHGRPCLCHHGSAMAEVAPGGGTLLVDMLDEDAVAAALLRLAEEEPGLLARLGAEAVARPIRSWDDYAGDVLLALSRAGAAPGWPLPDVMPAPAIGERRPLLSCAITTYNRAPWLSHSLPLLLEATRPWRDVVEVVVCDNASTDSTPEVVARFRGEAHLSARRNPANVGMLGNLGATARHARGAFVWLLGDDDLLVNGAIENVLEGLAAHPEVEMAYMNYAYTTFDRPERLSNPAGVVDFATPIAPGGPNRRVPALREVSPLNENLFTAIYACAFRRDHAIRGYGLDTRGAPFTSLPTCVPSSVYALAALQDRPAWWVGEPAVVVNMNVSWTRWVLLWHLERMPDLFDAAERAGVAPAALDRYRAIHANEAERWLRETWFEAEDAVRSNVSAARVLERCKHLPEFRGQLAGVRRAYAEAWAAGRVAADDAPPAELFARYGLEDGGG
jgi:glycosyltransferase involved in cell wall biosynthesis